jgi:HAD superfamily hydrolase (TIGR01509 family)
MSYNAVIFDKDGVLINSFETVFSAMNEALTSYGYEEIEREEFRKEWWGIRADQSIERKLEISKQRAVEIFEFYKQKRKELDHMSELYPDVKHVLEKLSQEHELGVVTSTYRELAVNLLVNFGIYDFFNVVVGGDETTPKPAPDSVMKACDDLGLEPGKALFVGDTDADIGAGKSAGCTTVILTTSKTREELKNVGEIIVIDNLRDLLGIVGSQ